MLLKKRMIFGLALLVAVFMGRAEIGLMDGNVLGISQAGAAETPGFAWHANRPNITRAQIALGRGAALKFEFTVPGGTAANVKFGIPKKFVNMGIKVESRRGSGTGWNRLLQGAFHCPPGNAPRQIRHAGHCS